MPKTTRGSLAFLFTIAFFVILAGGLINQDTKQAEANEVPHITTDKKLALTTVNLDGLTIDGTSAQINASGEDNQGAVASVSPTPTSTPTNVVEVETRGMEAQEIRKDIKEVFGEHADKAFLLLSCENASLNPNAINYNHDEKQTKDFGIFQINDYWQGIRHDGKAHQFLLDPKINVRIAWRIYQDDGYSFKLWTCGRKFGI